MPGLQSRVCLDTAMTFASAWVGEMGQGHHNVPGASGALDYSCPQAVCGEHLETARQKGLVHAARFLG